ncbi:MAG: M15 family metallopeptidase [Gemmatimonadota bacterium]
MATRIAAFLLLAGLLPVTARAQTASDTGLINIRAIDRTIRVSAGTPTLVRRGLAQALGRVAHRLSTGGVGLELLAGVKPEPADHAEGRAVDVRLVDLSRGTVLPMGTAVSATDRPDSTSAGAREMRYRTLLSRVMTEEGFAGDGTRWWHFVLSR